MDPCGRQRRWAFGREGWSAGLGCGSHVGNPAGHLARGGARLADRLAGAWSGSMTLPLSAIHTATPSPVGVPGAGIFSSPVLLSLMVWVPVIVALAIAVMPNPRGRYNVLIKQIAFFTNLGLAFVLFIAYNQFENFLPTMQYEEKLPWLPAIGVKYHLGVDGPGLVMLVLSGLIGVASVLGSLGIRERVRAYFALLLLAQ